MVGKNLTKMRCHLGSSIDLASIEADQVAILGKPSAKLVGNAPVPAVQDVLIERDDLTLVVRHSRFHHRLIPPRRQFYWICCHLEYESCKARVETGL